MIIIRLVLILQLIIIIILINISLFIYIISIIYFTLTLWTPYYSLELQQILLAPFSIINTGIFRGLLNYLIMNVILNIIIIISILSWTTSSSIIIFTAELSPLYTYIII